jgi:hypothetical protein
VRLNQGLGTDEVVPIPGYGDVETLRWGADNVVAREAAAASPLPPMPLTVLSHGKPFPVPEGAEGFTSDELEGYLRAANEDLATLVPDARFFVASESGHDIHQDQPELVSEAIRQVLEGVRTPDTWYSLASCRATWRVCDGDARKPCQRIRQLGRFADGYQLSAGERGELARRVIDVAILGAASDAVEARITPTSTEAAWLAWGSPGERGRRRGSCATVACSKRPCADAVGPGKRLPMTVSQPAGPFLEPPRMQET